MEAALFQPNGFHVAQIPDRQNSRDDLFFQIVISISVGLAAGCIPVVGYNIGAGHKDRAKETLI